MAETEVEVKDAGKGAKKPATRATIIKILLGVAIFAAIMALVFFVTYSFVQRQKTEGLPTRPGIDQDKEESVVAPPLYFDMGEFTLVISDETGRAHTLKTHIILTVHSERPDKEETMKELADRKPELTAGINDVLFGMDPNSFQGTAAERKEGLSEMTASIIRAVNARMKTKIDGALIQKIIFQ